MNVQPEEAVAAYRGVRERVRTLLLAASPAQLDAIAPATPEWRVRDIAAHLSGGAADILAGRLEGVTTEAWTQRQVDERTTWPIERVLDEWDELGPQVEPLVPSFGPMLAPFVIDAVTHEHDLRHALGEPGARDSDAIDFGARLAAGGLARRYREAGLGALRVETVDAPSGQGSDAPDATLRVTRFELVRATTGRRTADEIRAWDWDGEARPELCVAPIFRLRETSLGE